VAPLVTVVVTTHNRAELVPRAIKSVLDQTFGDYELIVVDDCSTDGTEAVVGEFHDSRVRYIRHAAQRGLSAARNSGVRAGKGRYLAFLDDDDEWLPSKLEKQIGLLEGSPDDVAMVYCWLEYWGEQGVVRVRKPNLRGNVFPYVLTSQPLGNGSTLLVRRSVVDDVGEFDENLFRGIDGDFIRRVCSRYKVDYVREELVRVHLEHGHSRISDMDSAGIENAIRGEMAKLEKFRDVLDDYPRQTSTIHAKIGRHYAALGDWRRAFAHFFTGIRIHPLGLGTYRQIAGALKDAAFSRTPGKTGSMADE
jgi:glycosyltransferase involved in cell wall biosynthesis